MKNLTVLFLLVFILSACGPSQAEIEKQVQEGIQKTQSAQSTAVAGVVATQQGGTATSEAKAKATGIVKTAQASTQEAKMQLTATQEAYCGVEKVKEGRELLGDIALRYSDKANIAFSTSRIALSPVIDDLQELRREAEKAKVPGCMEKAQILLVGTIDESANAFLAFMGEEDDAVVNDLFGKSNDLTDDFLKEMKRLEKCPPDCD